MSDDKEMRGIFQVLCTYLLYEREQETELRTAFAALVQERHNRLHDEDGITTEFTECSNQLCILALQMLQTARAPRVEVNDLSIQLIAPYNIKVQRESKTRVCIAYLEENKAVSLAPPDQKDIILKI